ncbi:Protein orai-2 [Sarcoptes scabiei]|uniref:Protein orai-2 n=2 Tax=Sarcoptes scabiei TaxID=52283 RepID=A0A834REH6_SARSC|nr:Protein orai-2 [Sarcoptes scabiei]
MARKNSPIDTKLPEIDALLTKFGKNQSEIVYGNNSSRLSSRQSGIYLNENTNDSSSSSSSSEVSLCSIETGLDLRMHPCDSDNVLPETIYATDYEQSSQIRPSPRISFQEKNCIKTQTLLSYNAHSNPKINNAIVTLGTATMFSSASLLTLPNTIGSSDKCPVLNIETSDPNDNSAAGYVPITQSPITNHPLINETRTRALSRAKLKQSSQVSALLSGFALVAMVEMDINSPSTIPLSVLMFFIITSTLLVSVHMIALMISTCILPHIESMNAMQDLALTLGINQNQPNRLTGSVFKTQPFRTKKKEFDDTERFLSSQSIYDSPPHLKMRWYISIAWFFSTVIGIFLFILELVAIVWVKFWDHNQINNISKISDGKLIAVVSTLLLIPVLLALIYFAFHFYRKLVLLRYEMAQKVLDELHLMADGLSACDQI